MYGQNSRWRLEQYFIGARIEELEGEVNESIDFNESGPTSPYTT